MADPGQAIESLEEIPPLLPQRSELPPASGGEAIVAAVTTSVVGLPAAFEPATFFHVVKQGIERREREFQSAARALPNLFGDFEAVKLLFCQQREDGQFAASSRDLRTNAF